MVDKELLLTYELASQLFYYEEGYIKWKHPVNKTKKQGQIAGGRRKDGRQQIMLRLNNKSYLFLVYRIIWLLHNREWPENTIDHIDGDRTNDRIENLRDVTQIVNNHNKYVALSTSKTKILGVSPYGSNGKFRASIGITEDGKMRSAHLGVFDNIEMAKKVYDAAKNKLHKGTKCKN
jgi:HNH endonuclease/AP2 domain